jgi:hypothetical protein
MISSHLRAARIIRASGLMAPVAMSLLAVTPARGQQSQTGVLAPVVRLAPPSDVVSGESAGGVSTESATDIAKAVQNPIGNTTSVPFQNNTNLGAGPQHATQNVLNFQPVVPVHIDQNWSLIVRTVIPFTWSPSALPGPSVPFGVAPTTISAFLLPKNAVDGWVWGIGPIVQIPTITNASLGSNVWGLGPTAVVVKLAGPIVAGLLISDGLSLGGTSGPTGTKYNLFTVKPFVNYNFGEGWFVGTVPIITANWAGGGEKWTLPVGGEFGRVIKIGGKMPINLQMGAYYNTLRPEGGAIWQIRAQIAAIF